MKRRIHFSYNGKPLCNRFEFLMLWLLESEHSFDIEEFVKMANKHGLHKGGAEACPKCITHPDYVLHILNMVEL